MTSSFEKATLQNSTSSSQYAIRWNAHPDQHGQQLAPTGQKSCEDLAEFVSKTLQQNPQHKLYCFELNDISRGCLDRIGSKVHSIGYSYHPVHNPKQLPAFLKKGYDYDDPALWNRAQSQLFVTREVALSPGRASYLNLH